MRSGAAEVESRSIGPVSVSELGWPSFRIPVHFLHDRNPRSPAAWRGGGPCESRSIGPVSVSEPGRPSFQTPARILTMRSRAAEAESQYIGPDSVSELGWPSFRIPARFVKVRSGAEGWGADWLVGWRAGWLAGVAAGKTARVTIYRPCQCIGAWVAQFSNPSSYSEDAVGAPEVESRSIGPVSVSEPGSVRFLGLTAPRPSARLSKVAWA